MDFLGTTTLISAMVALLVFVIYMAVDSFVAKKSSAVHKLKEYSQVGGGDDLVGMKDAKSNASLFIDSIMSGLGFNTEKTLEHWSGLCAKAGVLSPNAPSILMFTNNIIGPFFILIGAIITYGAVGGETMSWSNLILGMIALIFGLYGTKLFMKNKTTKHQQKLMRSFPDTLDLLVICVESGLALDSALSRVCKELGRAYPEITRELNQTRVELALLNDRPKALMNLAERTDLMPFRSLVAALVQTEKFGTSLSDTLRVLSEDYRMTRLLLAEQKAGKLPVIMTIPLILLLMPTFIMIILGPPFIMVQRNGGMFPD